MNTFAEIATAHLTRYPEMELQDLYKLAFQAALGNGHLVHNPDISLARLKEEMDQVPEDGSEPLTENIHPEGELVRINLRSFKFQGKVPDQLNAAMVETANGFISSTDCLRQYWRQISKIPDLKFAQSEVHDYFDQMKEQNFPAQHHSETYRSLYRPAYRIIASQYLNWI